MIYIKLIRIILNYFDHFSQKKILNFLKKDLKKDIILFDIGAHHGETIKTFSAKFNLYLM